MNYKLRDVYIKTAKDLSAVTESAMFEARQLCGFVFEIPAGSVIADDRLCESHKIDMLDKLVKKRVSGYPLQYILNEWEFYGIAFKVGEGVLIPRADSEILVQNAIVEAVQIGKVKKPVILDLCSGTGCIAISVKMNCECDMYALEISGAAIDYLRQNIKKHSVDITVIKGDLNDTSLPSRYAPFDIITANPPYLSQEDMQSLQKEVCHEPETALYGGCDGLEFYRSISRKYKDMISPQGKIIFEIGINMQNDVMKILTEEGYNNISWRKDLAGIIRTITVSRH